MSKFKSGFVTIIGNRYTYRQIHFDEPSDRAEDRHHFQQGADYEKSYPDCIYL